MVIITRSAPNGSAEVQRRIAIRVTRKYVYRITVQSEPEACATAGLRRGGGSKCRTSPPPLSLSDISHPICLCHAQLTVSLAHTHLLRLPCKTNPDVGVHAGSGWCCTGSSCAESQHNHHHHGA
eukprot:1716450-Rhodomonas_salina.1